MKNESISDEEAAVGFIMFAFVKTYQDRFISGFFKMVNIAYENGLVLRHGLLMLFLLAYSLFPYILALTSFYFILPYLLPYDKEIVFNLLGFHLQPFYLYLLISIFCFFVFLMIRFYLPEVGLWFAVLLPIIGSSLIIKLFVVAWAIEAMELESTSEFLLGTIEAERLALILILIVILIIIIPICYSLLDNIFKVIHFIFISHLVALSSLNISICIKMNRIINVREDDIYIIIYLIFSCLAIVSYFVASGHLNAFTYIPIYYILIIAALINFITFVKLYGIQETIIVGFIGIIIAGFIRISMEFIISHFSIPFDINILYVTLIVILLVSFSKLFLFIVRQFLLPSWWFKQKYERQFKPQCSEDKQVQSVEGKVESPFYKYNINKMCEAFLNEPSPKGGKFILQYILASELSLPQKLGILDILVEIEKYPNKMTNYNGKLQEVLDELAQIRYSLRQEQRQLELMDDVLPISQVDFHCQAFDFTDPSLENNHPITLRLIDLARKQLLDWLKGETPAKPSIDKLLIYQWKNYEIGIGLKYSGLMGGDFYDLFQLPTSSADNQEGVFISDFGLLVGDLTGHGVETALNLSKTHNFWAETDLSQDVLTTMRAFEQNFKTTFQPFSPPPKGPEGCALCYLQITDKEITLSNAGLAHPILIKNNQIHHVATSREENLGVISKWLSNPAKRYTRVELKAGETLIVYTDGLFENANQNGEQFGQDKFKQLLLQPQSKDMETLIDSVFSAVYEFCQPQAIDDDETLLVIRRISSTTD